ncbi:MAG: hypothetical protein AAF449_16335, partial [Myxococcota bacterium]
MFEVKGGLWAVAGISFVLLSCGHDSHRYDAEGFLNDASLQLTDAALTYRQDLDAVVFEVSTGGDAASVAWYFRQVAQARAQIHHLDGDGVPGAD